MLARVCGCERPQVFEDSDTCNRCGYEPRPVVRASTWRLALAMARAAIGDPQGRRAGRDQFSDH